MTISPDAFIVLIAAYAAVQVTGRVLTYRTSQRNADRKAGKS